METFIPPLSNDSDIEILPHQHHPEETVEVPPPDDTKDLEKTTKTHVHPTLPPRALKLNVHQTKATYEAFGKNDTTGMEINLALPADTQERIQTVIDNLPNVQIDNTQEGKNWVDAIHHGQFVAMEESLFDACIDRKDSQWHQEMRYGETSLNVAVPRPVKDADQVLTGEKAVLHVRHIINGGGLIQIPCWHTGIWLTLKTPSDAQLLDLNRRLVDEKISLGRDSHGLVFSNMVVFIVEHVLNLAFDNIYQSTYKNWEDSAALRSRLSILDLPIIAWGLACAIWPRGFQYSRAILDPEGQATNTVREKLNVGRLLWVDRASLNEWQLQHMTQRHTGKCMTDTMIDNYAEHFTRGKPISVPLNEEISMTLRVPSADKYLKSGTNWINSIVTMIDRSFGMDNDIERRDAFITDQGKASEMRQYAHWVDSVNFTDGRTINDQATIESVCTQLSNAANIKKNYDLSIKNFIRNSTAALVATPIVDDNERHMTIPNHPNLLPLDTFSVFFILLVQKTARILL